MLSVFKHHLQLNRCGDKRIVEKKTYPLIYLIYHIKLLSAIYISLGVAN